MAAAVLLCLTLDRNISSSSSVVLLSCSFSPVGGASCTGTSRKSTLNWQYIIFNIWYLFVVRLYLREERHFSCKQICSNAAHSFSEDLVSDDGVNYFSLDTNSTWNTESWFCFVMWTVRFIDENLLELSAPLLHHPSSLSSFQRQ